ncbi:MAG: hypothetical protein JETCAE03_35780 [Ignavibacteriaceae bacterium]|jgi:hypothetical protein|nr:MAG: hypothetical protein JETCAE03_35780 [Ignavibacteriaceae bacterium]
MKKNASKDNQQLRKIIREEIKKIISERRNILQLFRSTPAKIKQRARNDITANLQTISDKGKYQYKTVTGTNGNVHKPYIIPIAPKTDKSGKVFTKNPQPNSSVLVWCDCNHFRFNLEVALNKEDASRVINSNGAEPVVMNPGMKTFLCKHLTAAYQDYINRIKK